MAFVDKYVIFAMVFSICLILFRSGMTYHKWESLDKKEKILLIIGLAPYIFMFVGGIVLFLILKEVVV